MRVAFVVSPIFDYFDYISFRYFSALSFHFRFHFLSPRLTPLSLSFFIAAFAADIVFHYFLRYCRLRHYFFRRMRRQPTLPFAARPLLLTLLMMPIRLPPLRRFSAPHYFARCC
jgi:hypothetical protein